MGDFYFSKFCHFHFRLEQTSILWVTGRPKLTNAHGSAWGISRRRWCPLQSLVISHFLNQMNLVNLMLSVPLDFTRIPKKVSLPINYSAVSYLDKIQIQKQCMNSVLNLPDFPCKTKCQPYLFFKSFLPNQVEADTGKATHDGLLSSWWKRDNYRWGLWWTMRHRIFAFIHPFLVYC